MPDRCDVAARLAEGQPAVDHTQTYVQACHLLGYQHPDLTAHDSQLRDWYETEVGLDLRILGDDSAELHAAVNSLEEALWLQRTQVTEIATAWAGFGADSATRFLQRHCDVAAEVAALVRAAADAYAVLRDELWQAVDRRAAAAVAIDDRRAGERSAWLAAAHQVMAGAGDGSAAEGLVRQHVIPYVDNDIRNDWLAAMRAATASAEASYHTAIDALESMSDVYFEIPGELRPRGQPIHDESLVANPAAVAAPITPAADTPATVPAAVSAPPPAPIPPPAPPAPPSPTPDDLAAPLGDPAGLPTGVGGLGSEGGLAGSIGGVVGKIVDGIGGLLGSLADGFSDASGSADPLSDDGLNADDPVGDDTDNDDSDDDDTDDDDTDDDAAPEDTADDQTGDADTTDKDVTAQGGSEQPPTASESVDEPVAQQVAPPPDAAPPGVPPPPPEPRPDGSTPCEIAADELPQAGQ